MKKTTLLLAGMMALGFLAGCASTDAQPTAKKADATKKPAKQEEYVRYTPTGSWITKKVKKTDVEPTETESEEAARAMGELQRRGNRVPKESGG